jgi:hypothetical protein
LFGKGLENVYLTLDTNLKVLQTTVRTEDVYGLEPSSNELFFAFDTQFTPYQQFLIGHLPAIDLVTQNRDTGACLNAIETRLAVLPDESTADLAEGLQCCELVISTDTIVYLACSIFAIYKYDREWLKELLGGSVQEIGNWSELSDVLPRLPDLMDALDRVSIGMLEHQKPMMLQAIWKTEGRTPKLADYCLDLFVWSNLALIRLLLDLGRAHKNLSSVSRPAKLLLWLVKMLRDFSSDEPVNHAKIMADLTFNDRNDKTFVISGKTTCKYMKSGVLYSPRIKKTEIREMILGEGQNLLSPERRLDAILYNSPDLFN